MFYLSTMPSSDFEYLQTNDCEFCTVNRYVWASILSVNILVMVGIKSSTLVYDVFVVCTCEYVGGCAVMW